MLVSKTESSEGKTRGCVMASKNVEELKKRLYEIDDSDVVAGAGGDIGTDDDADDADSDRTILVAYFIYSSLGDDVRCEMWSDGVWQVVYIDKKTGQRTPIMPEVTSYLNTIFEPSRFSSARWDCVLKAADEAAKEMDEELVIGDEYEPEPAEPGEGIVY